MERIRIAYDLDYTCTDRKSFALCLRDYETLTSTSSILVFLALCSPMRKQIAHIPAIADKNIISDRCD